MVMITLESGSIFNFGLQIFELFTLGSFGLLILHLVSKTFVSLYLLVFFLFPSYHGPLDPQ